ncbi:MAG: multidrug efflux transporter [Candidatus Peregrinibacteria bacterium GW2011_GWF2_33_10]|nr:MAG: multidrug efflux transporter [Candidatus Peregrinibacteria bacterium GW2011_GWF2_33_10]OGJ44638.1 MAG: hypothetical protein A2263_00130 [Candidatus Peregrinibacteria bacterium RIFOXYA2_FULL_33_21]OGJ46416.1 MAG: hypothetical protein A2272_06615 [Candidatus Peregrinibacteria bacterium RIFOXYA12_FULL_33_12]OGJ50273.1 MAG: hypothetical protein A2307_01775 [Candidatus Peregrinibacteria bacterium RIFOXYB2_FULL_33_20]
MRDSKKPFKSSDLLYLEKLEFNPELKKTWLNFFVSNARVVLLMIIIILIIGIYSFISLPRESNPEVKIPIAIISTIYQGASPQDVEELITKKIESKIASINNIKQITSSSSNSVSVISVEFETSADSENAVRQLRDKIDEMQNDLPSESNKSLVKEISFDDRPIWSVDLTGPYDGFTLRDYADTIKDELEKIPTIREVTISGGDEREFEIAYDPDKLVYYGLSFNLINQKIATSNLVFPAGSIDGDKYVYNVRTDGRFFEVEILKNIPILHNDNGGIVTLQDIAIVREKAIKKTVYSRLSVNGGQPKEAITINVIKKAGGSVIDTAKQSQAVIDKLLPTFQPGVKYAVTTDMAKLIERDFNQLTHDFIFTLILVGGILFLIVGLKEAFVAGLAIPLVFFATFGVMLQTGISLNFLSLFSLILSLGLLVDDAIVVVSATKQYMKTGKFTPEEAVLLVLNDFKVVLTTTTLTTVWAFLPLLMATGIIGEFIKSIPITVSVTLIASLFIALMVNHPLAATLERLRLTRNIFFSILVLALVATIFALTQKTFFSVLIAIILLGLIYFSWRAYQTKWKTIFIANEELCLREVHDDDLIKKKLRHQASEDDASLLSRFIHGIFHMDICLPIYEKILKKIISTKKTRWKTLGTIFIIFIMAILLPTTGILKSEFFPQSNEDTIYINVKADVGLKLEETDKIVQKIENKLLKYKEIENFSTVVGSPGVSANITSGTQGNASHLAGIIVNLLNKDHRQIKSYDLAKIIREDLKSIDNATIDVASESGGPPTGSAFEARIMGDDLAKLNIIAVDLKKILAKVPGVLNPDISLLQSPPEYTFTLDKNKLEFYNFDVASVGSLLRTAIFGAEVTKVLKDGKEIKVMARFLADKVSNIEDVKNLQILNNKGQAMFLSDIAKIELSKSIDTITRIDQKRTILLSASIEEGKTSNEILAIFQTLLDEEYQMPSGYTITYGGENEQNAESVKSILKAMILAMLLIVSTLIVQFNSFKKAFIVLVTIPLALIGVFFGMTLFRVTLSFPGLIGILALFGIVVKNAIILMDKINLNLKSGIEFKPAIVDAGKSRLEAIFITSISTIFGILPITLSNETWTALGSAVIFGLMFSSFLTLFIVPTLFVTLIKDDRYAGKI